VALNPNATAYYNLGLFRAIYGDYLGAKAAYDRALRLDEGEDFQEALKDLEARGSPLPSSSGPTWPSGQGSRPKPSTGPSWRPTPGTRPALPPGGPWPGLERGASSAFSWRSSP
jgi:tetratricopeptide (TPR) repeat protein